MTHHIIVGGGPAATNAAVTIREHSGSSAKITLISDEPAHSRMALPYWVAGKISQEHTYTGDADYFRQLGVETRFGVRVAQVQPPARTVTLNDGSQLAFDNLLIATGSSPVGAPIPGSDLPGVQPMWSLAHAKQLLDGTGQIKQPRVVLIGAGFIGFIVLNAMFKRDWKLTVVEREPQVLPRMLDQAAAGYVQSWLKSRGVDLHIGTSVQSIGNGKNGAKSVQLSNGVQVDADIVIIATGIRANLEIVAGSGITTDQGILVNDQMQTNFPFIYAAGDVAQGPVLFGSSPAVHAIQPTAVDHGRVAGANMSGTEVHYRGSLLMNVVDVCGLQTVSFGNWNEPGAEETVIRNDGELIYRKFLWRGEQLVGAIFTGKPNDVGMLTDIGMIKGILQTETPLGPWKKHLQEFPFDVRRAYVGCGVAAKLVKTTLLGRPTPDRGYHFGGLKPEMAVGSSHDIYVHTKS